jgi:hypothetical protein
VVYGQQKHFALHKLIGSNAIEVGSGIGWYIILLPLYNLD